MTIFVPPKDIEQKIGIKLSADKSHYLISVLRCKKGDEVTVIDGKGKAYSARVSGLSGKEVFVDITAETQADTESRLNLVLCQGILKGEKMDLVVQKATELGAKEIVPLITERSVVRETRKVNRWRKIAEEAAEQCGRAVVPAVHDPVEISSWLTAHGTSRINGFIFWEEGGRPLQEAITPILRHPDTPIHIFIGPEGGLTSGEVRSAEDSGLIRTTLGKRTLRAETAAIAATALVQYLFEFCYNIQNGKE